MQLYDLSKISVLIVDDNRFMRTIVFNSLTGLGIRNIVQADGVEQALEQVHGWGVDLVISDWDMGELSGLDLIRKIRANSATRLVPIIMLTSNTQRRNIVTARDAGATEFLAKPVSAQAMYSRIVEVIERPRQYVKTKTYLGPDRRRKRDETYKGPKRRKDDQED